MAFTVLKKLINHQREIIEGSIISPSPSLLSYCYVNNCLLNVLDFKTERVTAVVDAVQDFIWREGVQDDELATVCNSHEISLYSSIGSGGLVKKELKWAALHEPEKTEFVFCNANNFTFLINKSHLANAVLIGDVLETVWCLESPCDILRVRAIGSELYVLTSQGNLFGYNIKDGSQSAHWELPQSFCDTNRSVDFCISLRSRTAFICVGHTKLYAVSLGQSRDEKDACSRVNKSRGVITGLAKTKTPASPTSAQCQVLLDLSNLAADQHVMWVPDDRHLVLCCGFQGLQSLSAFELDVNGRFCLVPSENGLPGEGSFSVVHDPRSTMGHAAAFLFADCTAVLTFGAATSRLLPEVFHRALSQYLSDVASVAKYSSR